MPRCRLILILFFGLPSALFAQKPQEQWSNLNRLTPGQRIVVIETTVKSHSGDFVSITDDAIVLAEKGSTVSIKRENVARVSTASGRRRGEHALIGLLAGGAIGAGCGAAAGSAHGFLGGSSRGITALVGVAIGAAAGVIVGAAVPAHTNLYRAGPSATRSPTAALNVQSKSVQASNRFVMTLAN